MKDEQHGNRILINGAFRPQRITGQQRYATEVADRFRRATAAREVAPPARAGSLQSWLWCQQLPIQMGSGEHLLTLTSRGPLFAPRHVVVIHDLFVLSHPEWFSRKYVVTHAPVLRSHLKRAAALVTVSEPVADQVRELTHGRRLVVTAPNAPAAIFREQDGSSEETLAALEQRGLARRNYFLTVGSLEPRKNLALLLRAYAALPLEIRRVLPLVVVGASSSIFAHSRLEPPEGVRLLGYVDDRELAGLYANARAVYFPTLDEGFGLPIVEALTAGADVVVSDIPVLRWVGGDHPTYLPPMNAEVWLADMSDRAADGGEPTEQNARRSRASDAIASRFRWDSTAAVIQRLIDEL